MARNKNRTLRTQWYLEPFKSTTQDKNYIRLFKYNRTEIRNIQNCVIYYCGDIIDYIIRTRTLPYICKLMLKLGIIDDYNLRNNTIDYRLKHKTIVTVNVFQLLRNVFRNYGDTTAILQSGVRLPCCVALHKGYSYLVPFDSANVQIYSEQGIIGLFIASLVIRKILTRVMKWEKNNLYASYVTYNDRRRTNLDWELHTQRKEKNARVRALKTALRGLGWGQL